MTINLEQLQTTLESYSSYGPFAGVGLTLVESFFPPLPLNVLIAINANVYGLWLGALYSWLGSCLGSLLVFLIFRRIGSRFRHWIENRYRFSRKIFTWVEHHGFTPIFLLSCFPFSPTTVVTFVSAVGSISLRKFMFAVLLGKAIMMIGVSAVTFDLSSLADKPLRLIVMVAAIILMWLGGRRLEKLYDTK